LRKKSRGQKIIDLKGLDEIQGRISFDVPMGRHTTIAAGGSAAAIYHPASLSDLLGFVNLCKKKKISYLAIGSGSNIIIRDSGTRKFLIRLSSPFFKKIAITGTEIICNGGALLSSLCQIAEVHSLGGSEFLVGIPGTVGGAVIQNAGAHGNSISDIIEELKVLRGNGKIDLIKRKDIAFGYRSSGLKRGVILEVKFGLKRRNKAVIRHKKEHLLAKRLSTQDYSLPSAGCVFKNPTSTEMTAAELIEKCGLKGKHIGGAYVSKRHANFIVNKDSATARDILSLIKIVKKRVNRKFKVNLEQEVEIIE